MWLYLEGAKNGKVSASSGRSVCVFTLDTFSTFRDKTQSQDILDTLQDLVTELGEELKELQFAGKTVTVKYKVSLFYSYPADSWKLHTFESEYSLPPCWLICHQIRLVPSLSGSMFQPQTRFSL